MQESMFQQLATISTRTIPLPKWRSTSKEWPLETVCVTLSWWMKIIFPFLNASNARSLVCYCSELAWRRYKHDSMTFCKASLKNALWKAHKFDLTLTFVHIWISLIPFRLRCWEVMQISFIRRVSWMNCRGSMCRCRRMQESNSSRSRDGWRPFRWVWSIRTPCVCDTGASLLHPFWKHLISLRFLTAYWMVILLLIPHSSKMSLVAPTTTTTCSVRYPHISLQANGWE